MLKLIESTIEGWTINVTKNKASRWHNIGDWPTVAYLLEPPKRDRFADVGDVVECTHVITDTYNYHGMEYKTKRFYTDRVLNVK